MKLFQRRFYIYFLWMLIIPPSLTYALNLDRNIDFLFFARAFAIAFLLTIVYYILLKKTGKV